MYAKFTAGLGLLCLLLILRETAFSGSPADSVHTPPNFDFTFAIKGEGYPTDEFIASYSDKIASAVSEEPYGPALANLTLGLVKKDPSYIDKAKSLFAASSETSQDLRVREISRSAVKYTESILSGRYDEDGEEYAVIPVEVKKSGPPVTEFSKIIIGRSAIRVRKDSKIKTQVDRVVRDWLQAYNINSAPWAFSEKTAAGWHEGKKAKELIDLTGARVFPVWGTKARKIGESWYAPDAEGVYRFEISEDKVEHFPTTIVINDRTAIINETHGISSIAWDALDADVVIGCGDHKGKIEAAYYLADRGVNVYVPTDRFLSSLIGTHTKGTIIGSAPVKKTLDGAVIGDQPLAIDINEQIVVSTAEGHYPLQYYDTPYRYFKGLEKYIGKPLNITAVEVTEYGRADVVVDAARGAGAKLLGIRVKSKSEHDAVYSWLKEDRSRRAVLFHSAVYPDGYRLFFEFPEQTSFGDIHIEFDPF